MPQESASLQANSSLRREGPKDDTADLNNSNSHCKIVSANAVAKKFIDEIRVQTSHLEKGEIPLLVGFLASNDKSSRVYADFTARTAAEVGLRFELRECHREDLEELVLDANKDARVHGIMIYFPVFGNRHDQYLQDVIATEKDVEGLSSFHIQNMYHNVRYLDPPTNVRKSIIPCTPLAIIKILEYLHVYNPMLEYGNRLYGRTVTVVNRSEVVGRPLAALLANDGATVYSIDVNDVQIFTRGKGIRRLKFAIQETDLELAHALPKSDVVITGVPKEDFKIPANMLKDGCVCINFSSTKNFVAEQIKSISGIYVPSVGKVTIAMLLRNLLRLAEYQKRDLGKLIHSQ